MFVPKLVTKPKSRESTSVNTQIHNIPTQISDPDRVESKSEEIIKIKWKRARKNIGFIVVRLSPAYVHFLSIFLFRLYCSYNYKPFENQ